MKKIVLIDLDNTLIDFNECARHSIMAAFKKSDLTYTPAVFETFIVENTKIWKRLEDGEITKAQLRENRWNLILKKLGIDFNGRILEEMFENGVSQTAYPVEGAYDLLSYLKGKYSLYVMSNGFRQIQENRLKIGNFARFFDDVFTSEDADAEKPSKIFFDYCFNKLSNPPKSDVILIGDSLTADITGALNYGIDSIWFNKNRIAPPIFPQPTHTVTELKEIIKIL